MALEKEHEFIKLSIAEAKKSQPEDSRVHPRVGVVVVKDGHVIAQAFRNDGRTGHRRIYCS